MPVPAEIRINGTDGRAGRCIEPASIHTGTKSCCSLRVSTFASQEVTMPRFLRLHTSMDLHWNLFHQRQKVRTCVFQPMGARFPNDIRSGRVDLGAVVYSWKISVCSSPEQPEEHLQMKSHLPEVLGKEMCLILLWAYTCGLIRRYADPDCIQCLLNSKP